jgi:hypothetical protein
MPERIVGTPTRIESDAERMISYRHQEHSWQTADGVTHLMVNRGTLSPGASLTLYSSSDSGQSWTQSFALENTNSYATSDGVLVGDDLWLVYSSSDATILFSVLHYDAATQTWSLRQTEPVFVSDTHNALNPGLAVDSLGAAWCALVAQDNATADINIRMIQRQPDGSEWVDTDLIFGATDNESIERSARPLLTSKGMGMVYSVHEKIYWAYRLNDWPASQPWTEITLFTSAEPVDTDPYASHFNLAADSKKNLHMAVADHGRLLYFRFNNNKQLWAAPRALTRDIKSNYVQAAVVNETNTVALLTNNQNGYIRVFQSTDAGKTLVYTDLLTHAAAPSGSGISYANPRMETPSAISSPLPVLQQYVDGALQKLLRFAVPASVPATAP